MAQWKKNKIQRENGEWVDAQFPIIVSASRSTDIPAFYSDWFFHRLKVGYSAWTNPFNGVKSYVAYNDTRFIVFWSKNPKPLLQHLDYLNERNINCYVQFTLNDYVKEGLEKGVPSVEDRIGTFKALVEKLGKGRVIWRFDPLILTDKITIDELLVKIENIGDQLLGYTEKLVFSFADIVSYKKVKSNLERNGINYSEWTESQMINFAERLQHLNKKWGYKLATCGEKIDIAKYGIEHNHCVDDNLMIRFAYKDKVLMDYLGVEVKNIENSLFGMEPIPSDAIILNSTQYAIKKKNNSDKGQRQFCGCMVSKDIGEYNTCPHLCEYCYANASKELAIKNYQQHKSNKFAETITGKL
jgi:DNA repair photolyase